SLKFQRRQHHRLSLAARFHGRETHLHITEHKATFGALYLDLRHGISEEFQKLLCFYGLHLRIVSFSLCRKTSVVRGARWHQDDDGSESGKPLGFLQAHDSHGSRRIFHEKLWHPLFSSWHQL